MRTAVGKTFRVSGGNTSDMSSNGKITRNNYSLRKNKKLSPAEKNIFITSYIQRGNNFKIFGRGTRMQPKHFPQPSMKLDKGKALSVDIPGALFNNTMQRGTPREPKNKNDTSAHAMIGTTVIAPAGYYALLQARHHLSVWILT